MVFISMCLHLRQRRLFSARFRTALFAAFVGLGWFGSCQAQITDSEECAQYLADHIASSSGGNSTQYLPYARKLAKTLSGLSLEKQKQILGFVPEMNEPPAPPPEEGETPPPDPGDETSPPDSGESNGTPLIAGGEGEGTNSGEGDGGSDPNPDSGAGSTGSTGSTGTGSTGNGGSTGSGGGSSGGSGGVIVVDGGGGGSGSGGTSGGGGGAVGGPSGTDPCQQPDGTPLNVSYPNQDAAFNAVFADATKAYWRMSRAAHLALTTGNTQVFEQNSSNIWGYHGAATFFGTRTASELQTQLDALYAEVESDLATWVGSSGASYPAAWPPTLPPVSHSFWNTTCP